MISNYSKESDSAYIVKLKGNPSTISTVQKTKWLIWTGTTHPIRLREANHENWFGLVLWHINHCSLFNAKSFLYIYIKYMISKHKPELIFLHTVKWFQVLLCITNNSIKQQSFVYTVKWLNSSIYTNSV